MSEKPSDKKTPIELPDWLISAAEESGDPVDFVVEFFSLMKAHKSAEDAWLRAFEVRANAIKPRTKPKAEKPYYAALNIFNSVLISTSLSSPVVRDAIKQACDANDREFFKRLGRKLSDKRPSIEDLMPEKLPLFLIQRWMAQPNGVPGLCYFADKAIVQMYVRENPSLTNTISEEHVGYCRRTLKLKKAKTILISSVS